MEARLYFADVRWAAVRLKEVEALIENDGEDWKRSKGTAAQLVNDPTGSAAMRHLSAVESLLVERESLLQQIAEARGVVIGIGKGLGADHMIVMGCYYLDCMKWDEVSECMGITKRQCLRLRDTSLDWVDSVGYAHAKEGRGIAE